MEAQKARRVRGEEKEAPTDKVAGVNKAAKGLWASRAQAKNGATYYTDATFSFGSAPKDSNIAAATASRLPYNAFSLIFPFQHMAAGLLHS